MPHVCAEEPKTMPTTEENTFIPSNDKDDDLSQVICNANRTNLIVNYLPPCMTQEDIRILFENSGEISSCKLIKDKFTGQSLGYGFVNFLNSSDAAKAIKLLNGKRLQNKTIKVSFARPSSESIKGANLYICGLSKSIGQDELVQIFSSCGKIITSRLLYDHTTGISKGVGFIRFDQRYEAEKAIQKYNGFHIEGSSETLTVKFANCPSANKLQNQLSSEPLQSEELLALYTGIENTSPASLAIAQGHLIGAQQSPFVFPNEYISPALQSNFEDLIKTLQVQQQASIIQAASYGYFDACMNPPLECQQRRSWKYAGIPGGPVQHFSSPKARYNPINGLAHISRQTNNSTVPIRQKTLGQMIFTNGLNQLDNIDEVHTHSLSNLLGAAFLQKLQSQISLLGLSPDSSHISSPFMNRGTYMLPSIFHANEIPISTPLIPSEQMPSYGRQSYLGSLLNLHKNKIGSLHSYVEQSSEIDSTSTCQTTIICFKNLPSGANEATIRRLLSDFFSLSHVLMMMDETSNGVVAFAVMLDRNDSLNAIQKLNGYHYNEAVLQVFELQPDSYLEPLNRDLRTSFSSLLH